MSSQRSYDLINSNNSFNAPVFSANSLVGPACITKCRLVVAMLYCN